MTSGKITDEIWDILWEEWQDKRSNTKHEIKRRVK